MAEYMTESEAIWPNLYSCIVYLLKLFDVEEYRDIEGPLIVIRNHIIG